jgi:hypothetical protein
MSNKSERYLFGERIEFDILEKPALPEEVFCILLQ